jgi:hypothetical protein
MVARPYCRVRAFALAAGWSLHAGATAAASLPANGPPLQLVAIDTTVRTYLDVVPVTPGREYSPEVDGWPLLAQWEHATAHTEIRALPFAVDGKSRPSPEEIRALLPLTAFGLNVSIADPPCSAQPVPSDATTAIQCALKAAGKMATAESPVNVVVPAGNWSFTEVLHVPANVRLVGRPYALLSALNPAQASVHLAGNKSGALFLTLTSPNAVSRLGSPAACGVWVGSDGGPHPGTGGEPGPVWDTLVLGNEVVHPAAAHFFGLAEHGGTW